jgi:glycosyltransferase involved in cell wall biosynthesis
MAYIRPTLRIVYSSVNLLEEKFAAKADALITVSEKMQASFGKKPRIGAVVLNCSDNREIPVELYSQNKSDRPQKIFQLLYIGNIVRDRGLMQIGSAINDIKNVKLIIAGPILDKSLFRRLTKMPGIQYNGVLSYENSIKLILNSDVMMILYNPEVPNNVFSCSNKMFEAMMCGLPIITNVSSEIVKNKANSGIIVDYNDPHQLKSAIIDLQSRPQLYNQLARNGKIEYLQNYNWEKMQSEILKIYDLIRV